MRLTALLFLAACGTPVAPDDAGFPACRLRGGAYAGSAEMVSGAGCGDLVIGDSIYEEGQIPIIITEDAMDCVTIRSEFSETGCSYDYEEDCDSYEAGFLEGDVDFAGVITITSSTTAEGTVTITRTPIGEDACPALFEVAWERR